MQTHWYHAKEVGYKTSTTLKTAKRMITIKSSTRTARRSYTFGSYVASHSLMDSEIHFQDIVVLEDNLLSSRIGILMSSYVVQAEPSWKSMLASRASLVSRL